MKNIKEWKKRDWIVVLVFLFILLIVAGGLWIREVHLDNVKRMKSFEELVTAATSGCFDYDYQEKKECLINICDALYPVREAIYGSSTDSYERWIDDCTRE